MSDRTVEGLNERERTCLAHLEEAKRLGVNFSRYCREKDLSFHQWAWVKRALLRKGLYTRAGMERKEAFNFHAVRCDRVVKNVFERIQKQVPKTGTSATKAQ